MVENTGYALLTFIFVFAALNILGFRYMLKNIRHFQRLQRVDWAIFCFVVSAIASLVLAQVVYVYA